MKRFLAAAAATTVLATAGTATALESPLVGYWPMNEAGGQVVSDWSGNRNHGQLGSTPTADANDPMRIRGIFGWGRALRFGGDDFVAIPDSPTLEPSRVTVEAWIRRSVSPGPFRYVVSKGAVGCLTSSYGLYTGAGGGIAFYISDGSEFTVSPQTASTVWDGRWHHVAGTFDGATVRLFVDGDEVGSGSTSSIAIGYGLPDGDGGFIGAYHGTCDLRFIGDIDEVRIWNRALPVATIAARLRGLPS